MTSPDENEHSGHAHFVMFDPREHIERRQMATHVAQHAIMEFIHGLTESQVEAFSMLMHSLVDPGQGPLLAAKFEGIAEQVLHFKFNWCMCGERHAMAEDLLKSDMNPKNVGSPHPHGTGEQYSPPAPVKDILDFQSKLFGGAYDTDGGAVLDVPEAVDEHEIQAAAESKKQDLLTQYNLIERDGRVFCKLCGVGYDSIRDRMLREPHDCPSCNIKNSQG